MLLKEVKVINFCCLYAREDADLNSIMVVQNTANICVRVRFPFHRIWKCLKIAGALTLKPVAYLGRPWERKLITSVSLYDSVGLKQFDYSHIISKKALLVEASVGYDVDNWLLNETRLAYCSFYTNRLLRPLLCFYNNFSGFYEQKWLSFSALFNAMRGILRFSAISMDTFGNFLRKFRYNVTAENNVPFQSLLGVFQFQRCFDSLYQDSQQHRTLGSLVYHQNVSHVVDSFNQTMKKCLVIVDINLRLKYPKMFLVLRRSSRIKQSQFTIVTWGFCGIRGVSIGHSVIDLLNFFRVKTRTSHFFFNYMHLAGCFDLHVFIDSLTRKSTMQTIFLEILKLKSGIESLFNIGCTLLDMSLLYPAVNFLKKNTCSYQQQLKSFGFNFTKFLSFFRNANFYQKKFNMFVTFFFSNNFQIFLRCMHLFLKHKFTQVDNGLLLAMESHIPKTLETFSGKLTCYFIPVSTRFEETNVVALHQASVKWLTQVAPVTIKRLPNINVLFLMFTFFLKRTQMFFKSQFNTVLSGFFANRVFLLLINQKIKDLFSGVKLTYFLKILTVPEVLPQYLMAQFNNLFFLTFNFQVGFKQLNYSLYFYFFNYFFDLKVHSLDKQIDALAAKNLAQRDVKSIVLKKISFRRDFSRFFFEPELQYVILLGVDYKQRLSLNKDFFFIKV